MSVRFGVRGWFGSHTLVKAQIHSGARGQAGGIKFCSSEREVWDAADDLLGRRLVTRQTGERGRGGYCLYVEAAVSAEREIYLGSTRSKRSS